MRAGLMRSWMGAWMSKIPLLPSLCVTREEPSHCQRHSRCFEGEWMGGIRQEQADAEGPGEEEVTFAIRTPSPALIQALSAPSPLYVCFGAFTTVQPMHLPTPPEPQWAGNPQ